MRDSRSAQRFARVDTARLPKKSALQAALGAVSATTWERINRHLLGVASAAGIETGNRLRIDSTVTHTHDPGTRRQPPAVRRDTRAEPVARHGAQLRLGPQVVVFHDHRRAAKRRTLEIGSRRGARRSKTYRKLLRLAQRTLGYAEGALPAVASAAPPWAVSWTQNVSETRELLLRVVDQTQRRVFDGETVPAAEKVLSLFEPHTDIILKGGRGTHFGHKVNFATGRSGLVLDTVVEKGNPADSARCLPMLERHIEHYGTAPTHAAFDGGYASRENLKQAKALGVTHAMFKKRGMKETDMIPLAVGVPATQALPRRYRSGYLLPETLLRSRPVPLARLAAIPGLRALGRVRPQPDAPRATAPAAGLTPSASHRRVPVQRPASARARCLKIDALRGQTHGPGDARRARARGESAFLPTNRIL